MKKRSATIKDIAAELDISPSTVSRALKDHFEISEATKKAVREVAEKLNYQPNSLALSLRYSKSFTLGIIVPEIVHFFFSTVISGIEDAAHSRGYNVIITQSNESLEREKNDLQTLYNNRVDGVLMSLSKETTSFDHLKQFMEKGLPIVLFDRVTDKVNCSKVTVDDATGAYDATSHLIKKGYRRIAHFEGPAGLNITQERLNGYRKALEENSIEFDPELVIRGRYSKTDSRDAVYELIRQKNPDAIFAFDDLVALEAIKAAKEYGKNVPIDFGVIGFCNWQFTEMTNPSISTVDQPGFDIGRNAAELLIDQLESDEDYSFRTVSLPAQLIARQSTSKT